MQKKHMVSGLVLFATAGFLSGAQPLDPASATRTAKANGTFAIADGDHGEGVGFVNFAIEERRGRVRGTFVFGAEGHHGAMYPDVTASMDDVSIAAIAADTVEFEGRGKLHLDPAYITARAYDGDSDDKPDSFWIRITDLHGGLLFEADGELFIGDVSIGDSP